MNKARKKHTLQKIHALLSIPFLTLENYSRVAMSVKSSVRNLSVILGNSP